jgi:hypothetical protein
MTMMFMIQSQDLRGDRGGHKEKKKPKAQKPAKGAPQRESMVVPSTPSKPGDAGSRSPKEGSGSDDR